MAVPAACRSTGTQRLLGVASSLNDSGLDLRKRLIGVGSERPYIRLENLRLQRSSIASLAAEWPRARSRTPVESGSRPELRIACSSAATTSCSARPPNVRSTSLRARSWYSVALTRGCRPRSPWKVVMPRRYGLDLAGEGDAP